MLQTSLQYLPLFPEYHARDPENTTLYKVVAENYKTFLFYAEQTEKRLPKYVVDEFEGFLKCGILAYGFLRQKCEDCKFERLVAFSCKKRGFCSSCGGRRMAECAAHLVDEVFPKVGVRQWVLSFPMVLRFILAKRPDIQSSCLRIVQRCISGYFKRKALLRGIEGIQTGAVTLIQRFGGSLNANVHFHILALEGGYYTTKDGLKFFWPEPPQDEDIKILVETISKRVIRFFTKRGYFSPGQEFRQTDLDESELLPYLQSASVASKIALGERAGERVRTLGAFRFEGPAKRVGPLCAELDGFSLHAGVYCRPWEREKLEKLCRYVARPAVSEERLSQLPNGNIVYQLKKAYSNGTTHLLFSPLEFMEKLAALVPVPRANLVRFHGILAPHAASRKLVVPKKAKEENVSETEVANLPQRKSNRISWSKLLRRVFKLDIEKCSVCGGKMQMLAVIVERSVIRRILNHLGLPSHYPVVASARPPPGAGYDFGKEATF